MAFENWPYTNFHDLNLDWIIKRIMEMRDELANFTAFLPKIDERNDGFWDITNAYLTNRLVIWDSKIFIAKVPVPEGISIENEDYWTLVCDIEVDVYTIREEFEAFKAEVNQELEDMQTHLEEEIQDMGDALAEIAKPGKTNYWDAVYFYVNQNAGNDEYPGTEELPFQTLERAFEKAQEGYNDLRLYITGAGTYTISKRDFSFNVLHMVATVSGVVVDFEQDADIAWYNLHVNIRNLECRGPENGNRQMYFEAGTNTFQDVNFTNWRRIRLYGGSHLFDNCYINRLEITWAIAELSNHHVTNTSSVIASDEASGVTIDHASSVRIRNGFYVDNLTEVGDAALISVLRSIVYFQNNFTANQNTNKYMYAFRLSNAVLVSPTSVLDTWSRVATNFCLKQAAGLIVDNQAQTTDIPVIEQLYDTTPDSIVVETGGFHAIHSQELPAGIYEIEFTVWFPANANGLRALGISTSASSGYDSDTMLLQRQIPFNSGATQMRMVTVQQLAQTTTLYFNVSQTSGANMTISSAKVKIVKL